MDNECVDYDMSPFNRRACVVLWFVAFLLGVFRDPGSHLVQTRVLCMCVSRQSMRQSLGVKFALVGEYKGRSQWWIQRCLKGSG